MSLCGSCNESLYKYPNEEEIEGVGCSLCSKDCHFHCLEDPARVSKALPGMYEALKDIKGYVCLSCISKTELQIINTLPLQTLPKYINYPFQNEEGRSRLLERMSQNE
jgi:hypothetical protein